MNKKLMAVLGFGLVAVAGVANASNQGHGSITFTGSIIAAPCSISPETADQTVSLGDISDKALASGGQSTPKEFSIELVDCDTTATHVTTMFTGNPSPAGDNFFGITGNASGASVAITGGDGKPVSQGEATTAQQLQEGNNVLAFSAYLQGDGASAAVVPGEFQSVANFTLDYQ
jgi:type 1 fimbria pilin